MWTILYFWKTTLVLDQGVILQYHQKEEAILKNWLITLHWTFIGTFQTHWSFYDKCTKSKKYSSSFRIDKDVQRCDRNHPYFNLTNLDKLRNIITTYVWENLDVGYMQVRIGLFIKENMTRCQQKLYLVGYVWYCGTTFGCFQWRSNYTFML